MKVYLVHSYIENRCIKVCSTLRKAKQFINGRLTEFMYEIVEKEIDA